MPKVTPQNLRDWFPLDLSDIPDTRLNFCLSDAARTLKSWIGDTNYEAVDSLETVKSAEAKLAIYHLLLNSGVRIRRHGLVKQESDQGGNIGGAQHEYFETKEILQLRQEYFEEAGRTAESLKTTRSGSRTASPPIKGSWA
jgi:hypothetical protein